MPCQGHARALCQCICNAGATGAQVFPLSDTFHPPCPGYDTAHAPGTPRSFVTAAVQLSQRAADAHPTYALPCAVKHCVKLRTSGSYRRQTGSVLVVGQDLVQEVAAGGADVAALVGLDGAPLPGGRPHGGQQAWDCQGSAWARGGMVWVRPAWGRATLVAVPAPPAQLSTLSPCPCLSVACGPCRAGLAGQALHCAARGPACQDAFLGLWEPWMLPAAPLAAPPCRHPGAAVRVCERTGDGQAGRPGERVPGRGGGRGGAAAAGRPAVPAAGGAAPRAGA